MTRPTKARPRVVTSWSPDVNPAVMQRRRAVAPNVSAGASQPRPGEVPLPLWCPAAAVARTVWCPAAARTVWCPAGYWIGARLTRWTRTCRPDRPAYRLVAWSPVAARGSTPRSGSVPPVIQALGAPIPEGRAQPSAPGGARGGRRSQTGPRTRPVRQDGGRAPRRSREGARHDVSQSGRAPVSGGQ